MFPCYNTHVWAYGHGLGKTNLHLIKGIISFVTSIDRIGGHVALVSVLYIRINATCTIKQCYKWGALYSEHDNLRLKEIHS